MKNKRIKVVMTQVGINQSELADILQVPNSEVTVLLNKYELAVKEQNNITAKIREWDALRKRGA